MKKLTILLLCLTLTLGISSAALADEPMPAAEETPVAAEAADADAEAAGAGAEETADTGYPGPASATDLEKEDGETAENTPADTDAAAKAAADAAALSASLQSMAGDIIYNAAGETAVNIACADALYALGLFLGTGRDAGGAPIYSLGRTPTRQEAVIMLIRLLGKEEEAKNGGWSHPFDDVADWAAPYVGYAYATGLTVGTAADKFSGGSAATKQQYTVFLLRALGYTEAAGDFRYDDALGFAAGIGLTDAAAGSGFYRGDVARLSYRALLTETKDGEKLAHLLLWEDVFSTAQLDAAGDAALDLAADMPAQVSRPVTVKSMDEFTALLALMLKNDQFRAEINSPSLSAVEMQTAFYRFFAEFHSKAVLYRVAEIRGENQLAISIMPSSYLLLEYYYADPARYEKNDDIRRVDLYGENGVYGEKSQTFAVYKPLAAWLRQVQRITDAAISENMSDETKVRKLHDWLCLNTTYDDVDTLVLQRDAHYAETVLFDGHGVCDGYAEAFKILMNSVGIECKVIYGRVGNAGHAWNQVRLDGKWYNVDVTWDDTINGLIGDDISHAYFCKADSVFRYHVAEAICKAEPCASSL